MSISVNLLDQQVRNHDHNIIILTQGAKLVFLIEGELHYVTAVYTTIAIPIYTIL